MMNNQSEYIENSNGTYVGGSEIEAWDICPWLEDYRSNHSSLIERWKLGGFFQDQDLIDINCHWLQFDPPPLLNHIVLIVLLSTILLTGCVANGITVYILARYYRLLYQDLHNRCHSMKLFIVQEESVDCDVIHYSFTIQRLNHMHIVDNKKINHIYPY